MIRSTPHRLALLLFGLVITGMAIFSGDVHGAHSPTPMDFKVAFIGDQGLGSNALAVLDLIQGEGAGLVLHQGDLDYANDPDAWDDRITSVLGPDFPYFASVGNHDCVGSPSCSGGASWPDYQEKLVDRLGRIDGVTCNGDLGVNSACSYKGLFFILSGVGTLGAGHEQYIADQLAASNSVWKICSWHKNQRLMQTGNLQDEVGWGAYEACRQGGAIIATGHEHSYSRTHLMDDLETQSIVSTSNTLNLEKGRTFVFVSGLGGKDIRGQNNELAAKPWWASVYNSTNGGNFGALFCAFNSGGVETRAHCYFKDIDGEIPDAFDLEVAVHSPLPVPAVSTIGLWALAGLLMASMVWSLRLRWRRLGSR